VDIRTGDVQRRRHADEKWKVTLVNTGMQTMTGGRVRRVREHLDEETFCLTYGDGVSDVGLTRLLAFHRGEGATVTLTTVNHRDVSGRWSSDGARTASIRARRSLPRAGATKRPGSTAGSPSSSQGRSNTSVVPQRSGNASPWRSWRLEAS
jgi:NDP-sugar pyrophosphorylase family protein